jgi:hypothetical protein
MSDFKVQQLQVDLISKRANVMLMVPGTEGFILLNNVDFDQDGEQTESQLKGLALAAAQKLLRRAADAQLDE